MRFMQPLELTVICDATLKSAKITFEHERLDFFSYQKRDYNSDYWVGVVIMFSEALFTHQKINSSTD